MTTEHPILYKRTSTGAQQQWRIWVEDNVICTEWGQTGGALQQAKDVVKTGKNTGKANATTPATQATLEAQAQWEKKLKKGYVRDPDAAMKGEVDAAITGGLTPMLAHRFDEHGHKIKYPGFTQPKLDGHRMIAVVESGKCTLWSRTRKPITGLPHIARAIEDICATAGLTTWSLDGEAYNHDYRNKFEELTSFIRQETPKPGHKVVQYHVYDQPGSSHLSFALRHDALRERLQYARDPLMLVETIAVADEDELMLAFERFLAAGYEGAMIRNADGLYVGKRSYDLLKIKEFADSEFECVGVEEGRGKLTGHAIFVCRTTDGQSFRAKLKGETAALKHYFDEPTRAIGRQLTVKYQGLTKNGLPRFPVALRFFEV